MVDDDRPFAGRWRSWPWRSSRHHPWVEFGIFAAALALSIALWLWQRAVYWKKLSSPG